MNSVRLGNCLQDEHYRSRSKFARDLRQRRRIALQYEAAREKAHADAGVTEAMDRRYFAVAEVRRLFWRISEQDARTVAGLIIKANAITSYAGCGSEEVFAARGAMSEKLAAEISAILGSTVS